MKFVLIVVIKTLKFILGLAGRGGNLPGILALALDKGILCKLKYPENIIFITGTNGKTTVTNMIGRIYELSGYSIVTNSRGDNLKEGIASLLIGKADIFGRVNADAIILEVDELSVLGIMKEIKPQIVYVNNLFRDQLDRAGEMENIILRLKTAFTFNKSSGGKLILNGDDPNVLRLSLDTGMDVKFFGLSFFDGSLKECTEPSEGMLCGICGNDLTYEYYQYSHIGRFFCDRDDFGGNKIDYLAEDIDLGERLFVYNGKAFTLPFASVFSIYNAIGVIGLAVENGLAIEKIHEGLETFKLNNGRMEYFAFSEERICLLNLIKNPVGTNETIKYIQTNTEDKDILIILNDNIADGCDVSWIWDADFEIFSDNVRTIICGGTRCYDMAVRLKYMGYPKERIIVCENLREAVNAVKTGRNTPFVLATYSSLQAVRKELRKVCV